MGEREHDVIVESSDDGVRRVLVDDAPHEVIEAPGDASLVRDPDGGRQLTVVLDRDDRPTAASVGGRNESVEVRSEEQAALEEALSGGGIEAGGVIKAPMPGRIVGILVKEGDDVEQGAPVVIIEAMKMENELHAPTSGLVSSVSTSVGATVEAGTVLCEITPHD